VNGTYARFLEATNHVHHIPSLAVPGVAVHENGEPTRASDLTGKKCDLVGTAERGVVPYRIKTKLSSTPMPEPNGRIDRDSN
jgi:hypothetical protein